MAELREEPIRHAPAPPPAPQHAAPQLAANPAVPAPSAVEVGVRTGRLLLHRGLWLAEQLWRLLRPQLGWVLLTTFLVGVIAMLSLLLILPRLVRSDSADTRVSLIPPASSVVSFLRGQQNFDADLMWESFSPSFQATLEAGAFTREILAEQMEQERRAGQRYRSFDYIGGVKLANAQAMYFYVVEVAQPQGSGSRSISFVFTVDRDGKIVAVE